MSQQNAGDIVRIEAKMRATCRLAVVWPSPGCREAIFFLLNLPLLRFNYPDAGLRHLVFAAIRRFDLARGFQRLADQCGKILADSSWNRSG